MSDQDFLSITEAARVLGVDKQTLRRWDTAGSLRPDFRSPGGHRKYKRETIDAFATDQASVAEQWASAESGVLPKANSYCENSDTFHVRLHRLEGELVDLLGDLNFPALITAVAGEIGNNSFDHNHGNWPDVRGIFFSADLQKRQIVLADRGQGILASLKRVRPELENDAQALKVAFTEIISGRAPEPRGNGLKFVYAVVRENPLRLAFQSGDARVSLNQDGPELAISHAPKNIRGTFAVIKY